MSDEHLICRTIRIDYVVSDDAAWDLVEEGILDASAREVEKEGGQVDGTSSNPTEEEVNRDDRVWYNGYKEGRKEVESLRFQLEANKAFYDLTVQQRNAAAKEIDRLRDEHAEKEAEKIELTKENIRLSELAEAWESKYWDEVMFGGWDD